MSAAEGENHPTTSPRKSGRNYREKLNLISELNAELATTLATRGVHLRAVASAANVLRGCRAAAAAPPPGRALHFVLQQVQRSGERREGVEPFAELHLLRRGHRAVVLGKESSLV
jgi:hypothetical protein